MSGSGRKLRDYFDRRKSDIPGGSFYISGGGEQPEDEQQDGLQLQTLECNI